jgi:PAS domain S-box-containing protein
MFKQRIIYRFFLIFLTFALILIIPFSLTIHKEANKMIEEENMLRISQQEREIHIKFLDRFTENIIVFSFYMFVFAFILSLFLSRSLLKPIRELYEGARSLKNGDLSVRLDVATEDELGEVTKSFNEMADALEKKTKELKRKELYISTMMDPLWVVSEDNTIKDINPAFTKLFGYSRDDVIGASVYDFLDEDNIRIMKHHLDERDKGVSSIYEISVIAKDGSSVPVLITGTPIVKDGIVLEKIGILKDFRMEHQLRDEIKKSRDYLKTIMDSIEDDLLVVDRDFRIIMANKAVKSRREEDIIGSYCHAILHGSETQCWPKVEDCPAKRVFETGKVYKTVHQHVVPGGKRPFDVVAFPIKDKTGNVIHVIELMRDVTDRKKYEEDIAQKNRELTVMNSIAGILSKSLKSEEIFGNVLNKLVEMLEMDGGGIFLLDETNKELTCSYYKGISEEFAKVIGRMRVGEDIPGKVAATGQIITTYDLGTDHRIERSILKHSGIKGYSAIPIYGKERIVGVFCLFSFKPHMFTAEEEKLMTSVGEMTGIAIENIRLYEKMRQLYEYQRQRRGDDHKNLLALSSKLSSVHDIKTVMSSSLDLIRQSFRADLVWLLEIKNGNLILKTDSGLNLKEGEVIYGKGTSAIEWYAVEKKEPIIVPAISSESRFYLSYHLRPNYKSAVCIPIYVSEKALGTLTLYYTISKELRDEDIHFLQIVSSILAVALERSEFYEKTLIERELSDTILQSISDGIMTVDANCRVISMNKAASLMIGIPHEKAAGSQSCDIFNYSPENTEFRWSLGNCLENALDRRPSSAEAQLTTVSGQKISVLISSSPVIRSTGEVIGVVHAMRNITREKEIDRMKTDFVKTVSHQFRTPLSAIVGMAEMILSEDIKGSRANEYLQTILSEGSRLSEMVGEMLNISRIESGKEIFVDERIDFALLLDDIKRLFSSAFDKKKGKLKTLIEGSVDGFLCDKEKLFELIKNLVGNSLSFSNEGCIVNVTLTREDDNLILKVSDNGWGIPDEDIPHLSEKFYRGRHGQRVKGTGLGLALCKEIITRYNGSISFDSKIGEGTTVTVTLPLRRTNI